MNRAVLLAALLGAVTLALPAALSAPYLHPLFFYPAFGCTFGEASQEQKLGVSHRARALEQMVRWLLREGDAKV